MTPVEDVARSYEQCRDLNRMRGSSFYWATLLLAPRRRPHVHALYAFARHADNIVDEPPTGSDPTAALKRFGDRFLDDLDTGRSDDPVLAATVHTAVEFGIGADVFERFLRSMRMDVTIASYETWDDLLAYMDGSAAAIGEMMLPILEPSDVGAALGPARDLGFAFQLTNFLRDVDEDLDRGRQYIPQEDLRRFGVDLTERRATPEFIELMEFEITRCRGLYASADRGIALLNGRSRRCIRMAHALYARILTEIERADHDVFTTRPSPTIPTKLRIAITP